MEIVRVEKKPRTKKIKTKTKKASEPKKTNKPRKEPISNLKF